MIKSRDMTGLFVLNPQKSEVLMLRREKSAMFHLPTLLPSAGGHFEAEDGGDPYKCVLRELAEETGFCEANFTEIRLKYIAVRHTDGELRKNYYFFAEFSAVPADLPKSNEGELAWIKFTELESMPIPVSARPCLNHYLSVGKNTDKIYCAAVGINSVAVTELGS